MKNLPKVFQGLAIAAFLAMPPTLVASEEEVVELEEIQVDGMRQELAMRVIKMALDTPRSSREEDLDKLICRFQKSVGSHISQLVCGTNRAFEAARANSVSAFGDRVVGGKTDSMAEIRAWRVNRAQLEARLERLGPDVFNKEVVQEALAGNPVPENLPDPDEINQFSNALAGVREITNEYDPRISDAEGEDRGRLIAESDRKMAQAIRDSGLTVVRYNEISEVVGRYDALRAMVRDQIADSR